MNKKCEILGSRRVLLKIQVFWAVKLGRWSIGSRHFDGL
jgi:hypothetical protein